MDGIRLTGLWKNESREGKPYMAGSLGSGRLVVYPNERKSGERDPDFVVYLVPAERRDQEDGGRSSSGRQGGRGGYRRAEPESTWADGGSCDSGDLFAV